MSDRPAEPEPTKSPRPRVKYKCGCVVPVDALESGWCAGCAGKKRRERFKKLQVQRGIGAPLMRLPAGSFKILVWDGKVWSGKLTIPQRASAFVFSADTEKKCYHGLHAEYTKWMASRPAAQTPSTT